MKDDFRAERLQLQIDQAATRRRLIPGIQVDERDPRTGIDPLQRRSGGRKVRSARENQQVQVGRELRGVEIERTGKAGPTYGDSDPFSPGSDLRGGKTQGKRCETVVLPVEVDFHDSDPGAMTGQDAGQQRSPGVHPVHGRWPFDGEPDRRLVLAVQRQPRVERLTIGLEVRGHTRQHGDGQASALRELRGHGRRRLLLDRQARQSVGTRLPIGGRCDRKQRQRRQEERASRERSCHEAFEKRAGAPARSVRTRRPDGVKIRQGAEVAASQYFAQSLPEP